MIPAVLLGFTSVAGAILLLPVISDLWSLAALLSRRRPGGMPAETSAAAASNAFRLVVAVPAHNESAVIDATLDSLDKAIARAPDPIRVVIVADNCEDDTAARARNRGFEVLERFDPDQPGKPGALGWALDKLDLEEDHVLVIVDADVDVDADFLAAIQRQGPGPDSLGQCRQIVSPRGLESTHGVLSSIFVEARYRAAIALKARSGLSVPVTGAGFVMGITVARSIPWEELGSAEDLEIFAILTARGAHVVYIPDAVIPFHAEGSLRGSGAQRRRWAGGRWRAAATRSLALLSAPVPLRQRLDTLAELWTPGPVEHLLVATFLTLLAVPLGPGGLYVVGVLAVGLARPLGYALIGVALQQDPWRAIVSLAYLPFYAVWRVGVLVSTLPIAVTGKWVKTSRARADPGSER